MGQITKTKAIRRFRRAVEQQVKRDGPTIAIQADKDGLYTIESGHKLTQAEVDNIVCNALDKL